jgi:hypothetical protein
MLSTGTMLTNLDLPLWPGHVLVSLGLTVVTVMMLVDLRRVRTGRSSLVGGE